MRATSPNSAPRRLRFRDLEVVFELLVLSVDDLELERAPFRRGLRIVGEEPQRIDAKAIFLVGRLLQLVLLARKRRMRMLAVRWVASWSLACVQLLGAGLRELARRSPYLPSARLFAIFVASAS
jgi:hypothetical protein